MIHPPSKLEVSWSLVGFTASSLTVGFLVPSWVYSLKFLNPIHNCPLCWLFYSVMSLLMIASAKVKL
jgi:hypothetical protein